MRDRWSSLLSVDDIITALFDKLTTLNKLEKTFIFYSSDHGYKLGQVDPDVRELVTRQYILSDE